MISVLPPSFFGVVLFKSLPITLRILVVFILLVMSMEIITYVMYLNSMNNMNIHRLYTFIEFATFTVIYYRIIKSKRGKLFILFGLVFFSLFSILNNFLFEKNSLLVLVESVVLILFLLMYFMSCMKYDPTPYLENSPYFILSTGLLLYFMGMIFTSLFFDVMELRQVITPWSIHGVLNIMLNICYTIVLWKASKVSGIL